MDVRGRSRASDQPLLLAVGDQEDDVISPLRKGVQHPRDLEDRRDGRTVVRRSRTATDRVVMRRQHDGRPRLPAAAAGNDIPDHRSIDDAQRPGIVCVSCT